MWIILGIIAVIAIILIFILVVVCIIGYTVGSTFMADIDVDSKLFQILKH